MSEDKLKIIRDYFARHRVGFGLFLSLSVFMFCQTGPQVFMIVGFSVSLLGLLIRSWAAGCIKKSKSLCDEGPYALVRHPLYLGSFLMSAGVMVVFTGADSLLHSVFFWATYFLYFWAFYNAAVTSEEKLLAERFADQWPDYKASVPPFFPVRMDHLNKLNLKSFSFAQYNKNKEYNAVLGWVLVVVFVIVSKSLF